ncbi:MAG: type II toxin-antitoxin system RelE/ParE family toxin [Candidatus Kryptoniota bacterium]
MRVEFLDKFGRDIDKLSVKSVKESVRRLILQVETAESVTSIPQVKKLAGFKSAYRIRIGDYRIGIFVEGDLVQFARLVHRKDIYKVFP